MASPKSAVLATLALLIAAAATSAVAAAANAATGAAAQPVARSLAAQPCFECAADHKCHSVPATKAGQCPRHAFPTAAACAAECKPAPSFSCVTVFGRSSCKPTNSSTGKPMGECKATCKPPPPPPPPPPAPPFPPLPPWPAPRGKCNYSVLWGVDGTNGSAFGDHLAPMSVFPHATNYMAHSIALFPELCQQANNSGNVATIQREMPLNIPNEDFDGVAQIDWEGWNPWSVVDPSVNGWGHGGNGMKLRNESIALVKQVHPTWNESQLLAEAEREYMTACTDFLVSTIQECKKLRPKAKWGFWNYPETTYTLGTESQHNTGPPPGTPTICTGVGTPQVNCSYGPFFQKLNDDVLAYYQAADVLTPSIYLPANMTIDAALRRQFILATVREAVRVRGEVLAKTGQYKPVVVIAWAVVFGTLGTPCPSHCGEPPSKGRPPPPPCPPGCHKLFHDFLAADAVADVVSLPFEAGADALLWWGHPDAFDHTAKDHFLVSGYPGWIKSALGPAMKLFDTAHKGALCPVPTRAA